MGWQWTPTHRNLLFVAGLLFSALALAGRSAAELTVNPFDAHPNVATHARAAERLAALVVSP